MLFVELCQVSTLTKVWICLLLKVDWDGYTIGYYGRIFEARNKTKGGSFEVSVATVLHRKYEYLPSYKFKQSCDSLNMLGWSEHESLMFNCEWTWFMTLFFCAQERATLYLNFNPNSRFGRLLFFFNLTDIKLLNNKCQGGDKDFFKFKVGSGQVIYYFMQYWSLFSYHTTHHFW